MLKTERLLTVFFLLFLFAGQTFGQNSPLALIAGKPFKGILNLSAREESRRYRLQVPDDAFSMTVEMDSTMVELDLALYDPEGTMVFDSRTRARTEKIELDRLDRPFALRAGTYEAEIFLGGIPRKEENEVATFSLRYRLVEVGLPQILYPAVSQKGKMNPSSGMFSLYELALPSQVQTLRLDIWGSNADLDLYLLEEPLPSIEDARFVSQKMHGNEGLILDIKDVQRPGSPRPGKLYVLVVAPWDSTEQDFSIQANFSRDIPLELRRLASFPNVTGGMNKAVQSTVEIFTNFGAGSGCVVHPSGFILTNFHVIMDDNDDPVQMVDVGFTLDPQRPSQILFKARLVDSDKSRDLALLQIESGYLGQDLPANFRFPYLEINRNLSPQLADDIQVLGYPAIGSLGSRTTITYSKGVVAGYQAMSYGLVIKTDAELNSGSSGGAALDKQFRLIGLPTQVIGEGSGQIAFINTLGIIPEAWFKWLTIPSAVNPR